MLNHSCDPSAFVRFDVPPATGTDSLPPYGSISVHAMRTISKDEEVTISYIDTTLPYHKRQVELKSRYYFDCSCTLCTKGSNSIVDWFSPIPDIKVTDIGHPQIYHTMKEIGEETEKHLLDFQSKSSILHTQVDTIKFVMKLLADTKVWPLYRYPWPQLRHQLFLGLLAGGRYFEAMLHSATFVRAIHPILYGQEQHPLRVMQTWTLINLCMHCIVSILKGEKTQEKICLDAPALGLLGCVLIVDLYKLLNHGIKTNGQLEKLVEAGYNKVRVEGGVWTSYQSNPEGARQTALSWLDKHVKEFLEREGVAQDIIELSRLSSSPMPGVRVDVPLNWPARAPNSKD